MVWTNDEIEFIKSNWEVMGDKELSVKLNRTFRAVKAKRSELGLFRKSKGISHNINEVRNIFDKKGYILISDNYKHNHQKLKYICRRHEDKGVQEISLSSILHKGCGCFYCGVERTAKAKMRPDDYYINWCIKNKFTYVDRITRNQQTYIGFYCNKHKDYGIQYKSITNVEKNTGCIYCNNYKTEKKVGEILDKHNISYVKQKRFSGCKDKNTLPFDYYIPKYNTAIEYDGEQHFKPVRFHGISEESALVEFEKCKARDKIKTKYCMSNDILLIRIPYYSKNDMESIILDKINERKAFYNWHRRDCNRIISNNGS